MGLIVAEIELDSKDQTFDMFERVSNYVIEHLRQQTAESSTFDA
jgi:CYTH domain-containing protein